MFYHYLCKSMTLGIVHTWIADQIIIEAAHNNMG